MLADRPLDDVSLRVFDRHLPFVVVDGEEAAVVGADGIRSGRRSDAADEVEKLIGLVGRLLACEDVNCPVAVVAAAVFSGAPRCVGVQHVRILMRRRSAELCVGAGRIVDIRVAALMTKAIDSAGPLLAAAVDPGVVTGRRVGVIPCVLPFAHRDERPARHGRPERVLSELNNARAVLRVKVVFVVGPVDGPAAEVERVFVSAARGWIALHDEELQTRGRRGLCRGNRRRSLCLLR